jgi:hypothetical protein
MANFVSEDIIEKMLHKVDESEKFYNKTLTTIAEECPEINAYLDKENFGLLTEEEYELMWFIFSIVFLSYKEANEEWPTMEPEDIETTEDKNWEVMNENQAGDFYQKLSPFFEGYPQEDLLAFLEDIISPDDESPITKIGSEIIFISIKSIIDAALNEA